MLRQDEIPEHALTSSDQPLDGTPERAGGKELPVGASQAAQVAQFPSQWQAADHEARSGGWDPAGYLCYLLADREHQQRHQARLWRLLNEAQLLWSKTLPDYELAVVGEGDPHQPGQEEQSPVGQLGDLATARQAA